MCLDYLWVANLYGPSTTQPRPKIKTFLRPQATLILFNVPAPYPSSSDEPTMAVLAVVIDLKNCFLAVVYENVRLNVLNLGRKNGHESSLRLNMAQH